MSALPSIREKVTTVYPNPPKKYADPQHVYSKPRRHPVVPYGTNRHESTDEVFEVPVLTSTRGALRVWPTGSLDSARGHRRYPWLRRPARTFAVAARARPAGDLRRRLH